MARTKNDSSKKSWVSFIKGVGIKNIKRTIGISVLALGLVTIAAVSPRYLMASDHDDGETDTKGRNVNLTDLFVFREQDQNPAATTGNLVFIMDTNPRSLPRQQYYFSNRARYEFNITRVTDNNSVPTGLPDITLRFEFSPPDANKQQTIYLTTIQNGVAAPRVTVGTTTPLNPNLTATPTINNVPVAGNNLAVFAGLREDPFFFDVEQYFRVRAAVLGLGPNPPDEASALFGFRDPQHAIDFAKDYNVNAISVRVPISFLKGATTAQTFDVWETLSVVSGNAANPTVNQVDRLAQPAINEGLVYTNDYLNTLNAVTPKFEADVLAGKQPAAGLAAPIVAEITKTLKAFGNSDARATALITALLPDVMRIDTSQPSGYAKKQNTLLRPITGRLLKDDVIDITLQLVTNNPSASDNVSYDGTPGNPAQGHHPLSPSFPYLAPAN